MDHIQRALRRLATGPETSRQRGGQRAIEHDLQRPGRLEHRVHEAQNALQRTGELLHLPPLAMQKREGFRGQVRPIRHRRKIVLLGPVSEGLLVRRSRLAARHAALGRAFHMHEHNRRRPGESAALPLPPEPDRTVEARASSPVLLRHFVLFKRLVNGVVMGPRD